MDGCRNCLLGFPSVRSFVGKLTHGGETEGKREEGSPRLKEALLRFFDVQFIGVCRVKR